MPTTCKREVIGQQNLVLWKWEPATPAAGQVLLIHGLGEHSRRYDHLAEKLVDQNLEVWAPDLPGHGESPGKRGHFASYDSVLSTLGEIWSLMADANPSVPKYLFGHSMGGNLALNLLARDYIIPKKALVTGPWIELMKNPPAALIGLAKLMTKIWPTYTDANGLDSTLISSDPTEVAKYNEDPLVHNKITARAGMEMMAASEYLQQYKSGFKFPVLMMHGGSDGITSPSATSSFASRNENCTYMEWKDMFHEIVNEKDKNLVLDKIGNWFDEE